MFKQIIEAIDQARHDKGISFKSFLYDAGISRVTYWHYRKGHHAPNDETLGKMLKAAGLTLRVELQSEDHSR